MLAPAATLLLLALAQAPGGAAPEVSASDLAAVPATTTSVVAVAPATTASSVAPSLATAPATSQAASLATAPAASAAASLATSSATTATTATPDLDPDDPPSTDKVALTFEFDPYYTDLGLTLSLSDQPIRKLGEKSELELYLALLPRLFTPRELIPRFMVIEASVNPLPCLGALVRSAWPGFYADAGLTPTFNWIRAATAGFEEPYALSGFLGNVVDYDIPGHPEIHGKGYGGLLLSLGFHHLKDNQVIRDTWVEMETKLKGDRRSPVKKLSWSFRAGLKFHSSPYIANVAYFALRRARLDYAGEAPPLIANSGFEYRFDVALDGIKPARHTLLLDKKWLVSRSVAVSLAAGFIWELREAYSGALAGRDRTEFQWVLRPNVEF